MGLQRRDLFKSALLTAGASIFGPAATHAAGRRDSGDDLAIINGRIVTLEAGQPEAQAVLVRNGRIVLVGNNRAVLAARQSATVYDAGERTVLPGFIDAHVHLELTALSFSNMVQAHAPPMTSLAQISEALKRKVALTAPGRWVVARSSYDLQSKVSEQRLFSRSELDAISTGNPIIVFSGLHVAMLNTPALKTLRLWDRAEQLGLRWKNGAIRVGTTVHREPDGTPTGVVTEIQDLLYDAEPYTLEEIRTAVLEQATPHFLSKGITSIVGIPKAQADIRAIQQLNVADQLPLRIRYYAHTPQTVSIDGMINSGLVAGFGDDRLRFGGLKLFVDGAGGDGLGRTFADVKWSQEELSLTVWKAHHAGLQCILHCVTRQGFEMAVTALAEAQQTEPRDLRHRIEHVTYLRDAADIRRLKDLGIRVTLTRASPGTGRSRESPWKSLVDAGLEPMAVSDSTGTTPHFSPIWGIASLMAPVEEGGAQPEGQALSFDQAVRTFTLWPARAMHEEADKGSIAPGKFGDFAVLTADPRAVQGKALFDIGVETTILGGRIVHRRS